MFSTNLHKSKHFFIFQDNLKIWELPGKVAIKSLFSPTQILFVFTLTKWDLSYYMGFSLL